MLSNLNQNLTIKQNTMQLNAVHHYIPHHALIQSIMQSCNISHTIAWSPILQIQLSQIVNHDAVISNTNPYQPISDHLQVQLNTTINSRPDQQALRSDLIKSDQI